MKFVRKISLFRIILSIIIIVLMVFPFYSVNITFAKYNISGIIVDLRYIICGSIFMVIAILNVINNIAIKNNKEKSDIDYLLDDVACKILINSVLIILACNGFIAPIIAIINILQEEIVSSLKNCAIKDGLMIPKSFSSRVKNCTMLIGLIFMLFYNLPFELINIRLADFLIYFATIMSVVSGFECYYLVKKKRKNVK